MERRPSGQPPPPPLCARLLGLKTPIVISGPPGSGKSTLAEAVAAEFSLTVIEKDVIKEALFESLGIGDREWSRRLSDASFQVMFALSGAIGHPMLVGNFRSDQRPGLMQLESTPIEIHCRCDREELVRRVSRRDRHPGHLDDITVEEVRKGVPSEEPLRLGGPYFEVDTTNGIKPGPVIEWLREIESF